MDTTPVYGRRSDPNAAPQCPRHPHEKSVSYCKRCNRPTCVACTIPTEVGSICVDCTNNHLEKMTRRSFGVPVTVTLIGINVALYLLEWVFPALYQLLAFNPPSAYFEPWRFLTTAFLHAGIFHLAMNMFSLYWTGQALEPVMGRARYLALYVLAALGGTTFVLAWVLAQPSSFLTVTVGASGAVFGLFGAILVLQKAMGVNTQSMLSLLGVNLLYGFLIPGISWQAHLGGLLVGVLSAWLMLKLDRPVPGMTARKQNLRTGIVLVVLGLALAAIQAGIYALLLQWNI